VSVFKLAEMKPIIKKPMSKVVTNKLVGNSKINKLYEIEMRKNNVTLWTLEPRVLR
jgi:hypothetical protein